MTTCSALDDHRKKEQETEQQTEKEREIEKAESRKSKRQTAFTTDRDIADVSFTSDQTTPCPLGPSHKRSP